MKKSLHKLLLCLVLICMAQTVAAQKKLVTVYTVEGNADQMELFAGATAFGTSSNGEYVVGYGTDFVQGSFIWQRSTGEFTQLKGCYYNECYAYGVSDNGVVVGTFASDNNGEVEPGTVPYIIPGYWKDGTWTALELAVEMVRGDVNGKAAAVSPDGRVIVGSIRDTYQQHYYDVATGNMNAVKEVTKIRPAVWIDGKLQPFENLPFGETVGQGMWADYMSDDAAVLGGVAEHDSGSRSPTIWVNGEMKRLYGKEDIDINVDLYFYAGYVYGISRDGKLVCGTWCPYGDDGYSPTVGFIYDVTSDTVEELEGWGQCTTILNNGTVFGNTGYLGESLIRIGDFNGKLSDYVKEVTGAEAPGNLPSTIISASRDGNVFGGYYVYYSDMGPMMMPSIVVMEDDLTGINQVSAQKSIAIKDGVASAPGAESLKVYDAAGRLVAEGKGGELHLGQLNGVVVVKANYGKKGAVATQFLLK